MNYIGIDIGGTNLKAGLVDDRGTVLATKKVKIAQINNADALAWAMVSMTQELAEAVKKAVNRLPQPDREIFLRHYWYAQTLPEISECMHLNVSTVKTRLRRGRLRLKELLTRWDVG